MGDDSNWLAVRERVLRGINHYDVLTNPPTNEQEVGWLADAITDDVVAAVELSRDQKRAARQRWRERRKGQQDGSAGR